MATQFQNQLNFIEDLLEDFKTHRVDICRRIFGDNSELKRNKTQSAESVKLSDIVDWLHEGEDTATPLPHWKEHLIQVYVKNTVESRFNGEVDVLNSQAKQAKMNKKDIPPLKVRATRILRGKVKKCEKVVEKKKNGKRIANPKKKETNFRDNPLTGVNKNHSQGKGVPLPKNSNRKPISSNYKKVSTIKTTERKNIIGETSKVDNMWKDVFSRNNLNGAYVQVIEVEQTPDKLDSDTIRPISPLIAPNVSITPRKFVKKAEEEFPVSPFNINKFLAKIKSAPLLPGRKQEVSPPSSEAVSSFFTYPIRESPPPMSSFNSADESNKICGRHRRFHEIKKSLLDLESPPSSSANSTICRVLDDCFDTYNNHERQFEDAQRKDFACPSVSLYTSCPCPDCNWRRPSSTLSDCSGISFLENKRDGLKDRQIEQPMRLCAKPEDRDRWTGTWSPSSATTKSSTKTNSERDLHRMQLEADPKFKRVVEDIRRESEKVLRRITPRINQNEEVSGSPRKLEFQEKVTEIVSYKPKCCSSLSTGLSEMHLGSDFTDANSDILLYPTSSDWNSL